MPVNLVSEHLFIPSLPQTLLSTTNPNNRPTKPSHRAILIFSHKLKLHQCTSTNLGSPLLLTHHQHRPRTVLARASSKGLLDDEAELSDWVTELASDSALGNGHRSTRGRGRGERGGGRGRGRVSSGSGRGESDLGRYGTSNGERGRDSFGSFSRGRGRGSGGDGLRGRNEGFVSPRREEGRWRGRGMGRESFRSNSRGAARDEGFGSRRREDDWRRESGSGDSGMSNRQTGRGGLGSSARNSRGHSRFGSGSEGGWKMPRTAGGGSELGYGRKGGGGSGEFSNGGTVSVKGGVLIAEEGRVEKEELSFADMINEEDNEGEGEKDTDDDGDVFASNRLPSSPETSDSYLSETRFSSEHSNCGIFFSFGNLVFGTSKEIYPKIEGQSLEKDNLWHGKLA